MSAFSTIFHQFHPEILPSFLCHIMPVNYHQLPSDGLPPCSCFLWPFVQFCINMPAVTNKGGEWLLFKALLSERKAQFTPKEGKSSVCL